VPAADEVSTRAGRKGKVAKAESAAAHTSPDRSGKRKGTPGKTKSKTRLRDKKAKGKRR
jgi:hypothetical protein